MVELPPASIAANVESNFLQAPVPRGVVREDDRPEIDARADLIALIDGAQADPRFRMGVEECEQCFAAGGELRVERDLPGLGKFQRERGGAIVTEFVVEDYAGHVTGPRAGPYAGALAPGRAARSQSFDCAR